MNTEAFIVHNLQALTAMVKHLVSGFDINAQDSQGKMPLHVACEHGREETVSALLNFAVKISDERSDSAASDEGEVTQVKQGPSCHKPVSKTVRMRSRESILSQSMRESSHHSLHSLQSQGSSTSYDHTPSPGEGTGGPFCLHPTGELYRLLAFIV